MPSVNETLTNLPIVVCISGHDPSGGAGLQADIEAVAACGGFAHVLPTALTVQNRHTVQAVEPVSPDLFQSMLDCLRQDDLQPAAIKFGLIASVEILDIVTDWLEGLTDLPPVILDPVLRATSGSALSNDVVARALTRRLIPLGTVLTPNQHELRALTGCDDFSQGAAQLTGLGASYVLVTGGDAGDQASDKEVVNRLYANNGLYREWAWPRLPWPCHGSGCTLASALAGYLARGEDIVAACELAQRYTHQTLTRALDYGDGPRLPRRLPPLGRSGET